jgi:hypothetical protein
MSGLLIRINRNPVVRPEPDNRPEWLRRLADPNARVNRDFTGQVKRAA